MQYMLQKIRFFKWFFNAAKLNRNKYFSQSTFFCNTSVRKKILKSMKIILYLDF